MDDDTVLYFICGFCVLFGALCAYAIYHDQKEERRVFYKYKHRKVIANSETHNFDFKRSPSSKKTSVDVKKTTSTDTAPAVGPVPAALLAPSPPGPGLNTSQFPPPVVLASSVGVVGLVGEAALPAAANAGRLPPINEQNESSKPEAAKKGKKKKVLEFDEYRNGSPENLPKPEPAPEAASYEAPTLKATGAQAGPAPSVDTDGLNF